MKVRRNIPLRGSVLFGGVLLAPDEKTMAFGYDSHEERINDLVPKAALYCADHWYSCSEWFTFKKKNGQKLQIYEIFCPKQEAVSSPPEDLIFFCAVGHSSSLRDVWRSPIGRSYLEGVHLWILGVRYATRAEIRSMAPSTRRGKKKKP